MTLEQLGKRASLTCNFIGSVEHGQRNPSVTTVDAIARGLDVSIADLLGQSAKLSPAAFEAGRLFDGLSGRAQGAVMQILRAEAPSTSAEAPSTSAEAPPPLAAAGLPGAHPGATATSGKDPDQDERWRPIEVPG